MARSSSIGSAALFVIAALAVTSKASGQGVIPASEAARHIGEQVVVEGVIAQVSHSGRSSTTFLNFGARFPQHTFAAVIFSSAAAQFPNPDQWEGRRVRVSGLIREYRGKPEIVLNQASQLVAVGGS